MKFLKTISVEELKSILDSIQKLNLEEEIVPIGDSFNRVISQDIKSAINVPHFRKSRMDGYAIIAEDIFEAEENHPVSLEFTELINAGDIPKKKLMKGQCSYVATGAVIPEGADAVIMVEFTERKRNTVEISKAVTPGTHIVNIGHDINKEQIICKQGTLIDLPTIGILSSCGINQIPVYKKPKVSLISTGNEIVPHHIKNLDIGKIYDINSVVLYQAIKNTGAQVEFLGIVKDELNSLNNVFEKALESSDIVVMSGGTSKGEGDLMPQLLQNRKDVDVLVHGVKQKPGKPLIYAQLRNKIIFVLPGFPTSALSCYYVFIENFLRKLSGYPLKEQNSKVLEVGERIYSEIGRHEFKTVKIEEIDKVKKIFPIKTGSEAISTMFYADGYIEIEELESIIEKGDMRRVFLF